MPPFPISSMSGSFQCPGAAYGARRSCSKPIRDIEAQVSPMSPVVRQRFPPTSGPHVQTSWRPYWQRLNTMGRPAARSASPIF